SRHSHTKPLKLRSMFRSSFVFTLLAVWLSCFVVRRSAAEDASPAPVVIETPGEAPSTPTQAGEATPTPPPPRVAPVAGAPGWSRAWGEYALLDSSVANNSRLVDIVREGVRPERILRVQVLLDRMHYSVGEIDAAYGSHTREAIA